MAIVGTGAALPSSSSHKYQVFVSFRGKDTRKNFTDHFYKAMLQAEIHTFIDEHEVEKGKNIGFELKKAINESEIAVIIFSKNYSESDWCLDELLYIMIKRVKTGLTVIPVFYDVQPSEVRSQSGSFGEAFSKHEGCITKDKIGRWKAALKQAADLSGMVLQNEADGYETKFIEDIIQHIKKKLNQTPIQNSIPEPGNQTPIQNSSPKPDNQTPIQNSSPEPEWDAAEERFQAKMRIIQAHNDARPKNLLEALKTVARTPMSTRLSLLRNIM